MSERAVRLDDDPARLAHLDRLAALEERRQLDLIDGGDDLRVTEELLEVRPQEVADADGPGALLGVKPLERAPRVEPLASDRPVEKVEIDVLEPEPLQARVEGAERRVEALVGVPELGRDEHLLARQAARAHAVTDVALVAVDPRGVDVPVAEAQRGGNGLPRCFPARRLPDAEPDLRNAAPELSGNVAVVTFMASSGAEEWSRVAALQRRRRRSARSSRPARVRGAAASAGTVAVAHPAHPPFF